MLPFVRCFPLLACAACMAFGPATQAATYTIHVCEDGRGHRTYQDAPCGRDARSVGSRSYAIATPDPGLVAHTRAIGAEMDRRNRGDGRGRVVRTTVARKPPAVDPCRAAKARRQAELKRVGLKRTFDLLRRLDDEVWDVCKGF